MSKSIPWRMLLVWQCFLHPFGLRILFMGSLIHFMVAEEWDIFSLFLGIINSFILFHIAQQAGQQFLSLSFGLAIGNLGGGISSQSFKKFLVEAARVEHWSLTLLVPLYFPVCPGTVLLAWSMEIQTIFTYLYLLV